MARAVVVSILDVGRTLDEVQTGRWGTFVYIVDQIIQGFVGACELCQAQMT